jgi:hypothetical protein
MQQQSATTVNVGVPPVVPVAFNVLAVPLNVIDNYSKNQSIAIAITLIVCGVLSIVFNIVDPSHLFVSFI